MKNDNMERKRVFWVGIFPLILFVTFCIFSVSCISHKWIKFKDNNEEVKTYTEYLSDYDVVIKIKAGYMNPLHAYELVLILDIINKSGAPNVDIKMENIKLILDQNQFKWKQPHVDSMDSKFNNRKSTIYKVFHRSFLTEEDNEYIRANKYPLKLEMDNVIFIDGSAINIDPIYATFFDIF